MTTFIRTNGYGVTPRALLADPWFNQLFGDSPVRGAKPEIRVDVEETGDAYLVREQPFDCAGAVKSESLGIALFERISSDDPTALIGLPLIALTRMLRAEGFDVLAP